MRRMLLRLVSCVSVLAYLLANAPAALALDHWQRSFAAAHHEEPAQKPRKCKHCCNKDSAKPAPAPRTPCDSSCPCDPKAPCQKCPGCALCSVAKAPCVTDRAVALDDTAWIGESCDDESFDYIA